MKFGAPQVAKSFAALGVETGGVIEAESPLEIKQNDTSNYRAITTIEELTKYIDAALKAPVIAYDSETTSFNTSLN